MIKRLNSILVLIMLIIFINAIFFAGDKFLIENHQLQVRSQCNAEEDLWFFHNRNAVMRYQRIDLASAVISKGALSIEDNLILNLFSDKEWNSCIDLIDVNINYTLAIRGRMKGYNFAYFIISTTNEKTYATIDIPETNEYFIITSKPGTSIHYLMEMDRSKMDILESHSPLLFPMLEKSENYIEDLHVDDSEFAEIDVMIVYTPAANTWANNNYGNIENVISDAMQRAQLVCDNSNALINMNLVHSAQVSYTESGIAGIDLRRITASTSFNPWGEVYEGYTISGYMYEVHDWRNENSADLVALFQVMSGTGGIAWLLNSTDGRPDYAFSITRVQQAGISYTHIHEMGHNMGTHHHKEQNSQPGPGLFSYSAGWRWTGIGGGRYCSVMTYESGYFFDDWVTHTRVPHFSNPDIDYDGIPTGHSADGDNARGLREIRHIIADYRTADDASLQNVYRFFNTQKGGHLYTVSELERDYIIDNLADWSYEGPVFKVNETHSTGTIETYRFFNTITGIHLYTISEHERDTVMQLAEWNYEGISFYVSGISVEGSIPVFRFFNHIHGGHLYTICTNEKDTVMNLPDWTYEGTTFYVWPLDS